jgi:hypothetical protein
MLVWLGCAPPASADDRTGAASAGEQQAAIIGLDHMPFAVRDLELATQRYHQLGFAIKPGRFHADGIRNNHVKFPDGSGVELITASAATDSLARDYLALIREGEGPAYLSFHARNLDRLIAALTAAGIRYSVEGEMITLLDAPFKFIFFDRDNRASTDRPEHFAHANSATAMTAVWIASQDTSELIRLLTVLGATVSHQMVHVPEPVTATVLAVENGRVILLPQSFQLIKGRPIVGATFRVANLDTLAATLAAAGLADLQRDKSPDGALFVPPRVAHGMWLAFARQ